MDKSNKPAAVVTSPATSTQVTAKRLVLADGCELRTDLKNDLDRQASGPWLTDRTPPRAEDEEIELDNVPFPTVWVNSARPGNEVSHAKTNWTTQLQPRLRRTGPWTGITGHAACLPDAWRK